VPENFALRSAVLGDEEHVLREVEPRVLALDVPALDSPRPFSLSFTGEAVPVPRRPFQAGRIAEIVLPGALAAQPAAAMRLMDLVKRAPLGYRLAAYADCGTDARLSHPGGPLLRAVRGKPFAWKGASASAPQAASVLYDEESVVFEVKDLEPGRSYQLAFTWWDYDNNGRIESVIVTDAEGREHLLVDRARLPAFQRRNEPPAAALFHLPASVVQGERFLVAFRHDAGAHNAVVSEIWLWESQ
jgi:hypothetical protein